MDLDKKRIVIKVGTSTITHEDGSINFRIIDRICRVLSAIESLGYKTVLVSSGALGGGVKDETGGSGSRAVWADAYL